MSTNSSRATFLVSQISEQTRACIIWPFAKTAQGYGMLTYEGKLVLAHRLSFYIANGIWPEPCGRHTCDVRACYNPLHVVAGTKADNTRDMVIRGRTKCKITADVVREIRKRHTPRSAVKLAPVFGVSPSLIRQIVNRKSWAHID